MIEVEKTGRKNIVEIYDNIFKTPHIEFVELNKRDWINIKKCLLRKREISLNKK